MGIMNELSLAASLQPNVHTTCCKYMILPHYYATQAAKAMVRWKLFPWEYFCCKLHSEFPVARLVSLCAKSQVLTSHHQ